MAPITLPGHKSTANRFLTVVLLGLSLSPFVHVQATDTTAVSDVSGDGRADVATFTGNDESGINVTLYSSRNGRELSAITFLDSRYRAYALERIVQMPGTGLPALAVVATRISSNRHVVQVRDLASGDFIADYRVLNSLWEMVDLTVIDDLNGDGVFDDPALAILARLPKSGKMLAQIIRLSDGVVLANRTYLNRLWTPVAIAAAQRPGMPTVLAILAILPSSNKMLIESRYVSDGVLQRRFRVLNRLWAGQDLTTLADLNGDGDLSDPAWLVLARNANGGANVVDALQVVDGISAGLRFVLNRLWKAGRLAVAGDMNGNGQEELIVSASRPDNGNRLIGISDFDSGESLRNVFPPAVPVAGADGVLRFYQSSDGGLWAVDPLNPTGPPLLVDPDAAPPPDLIVASAIPVLTARYEPATSRFTDIQPQRVVYSRTDGTLWQVAVERVGGNSQASAPTPVQLSSEAEAAQLCGGIQAGWGITQIPEIQVYYVLPGPDQDCVAREDNVGRVVSMGMDSTQPPMDFPGDPLDAGVALIDTRNGASAGWLARDANILNHVAPNLSTTQVASFTDFVFAGGQVHTGHVFLNIDGNVHILDLVGGGALIDSGYDFPVNPLIGQRFSTNVHTDGERWLFVAPTDDSNAALLAAETNGSVDILHEPSDVSRSFFNLGPVYTRGRVAYQYETSNAGFATKVISLTRAGTDPVTLHDDNFAVSFSKVMALFGASGHVFFQTVGLAPSTLYVVRDDGSEPPVILDNTDTVAVNAQLTETPIAPGLTTAESVFLLEGVGQINSAGGATLSAFNPRDPDARVVFGEIPDEFQHFFIFASAGRYKLAQANEAEKLMATPTDVFFLDAETPGSLLRITDTEDVSEFPIAFH